jgi:hypothetical protein
MNTAYFAFALFVSFAEASGLSTLYNYQFVPDIHRPVGISVGGAIMIGKLNLKGDFIHERTLKALKFDTGETSFVIAGSAPEYTLINWSSKSKSRVYEYRSGTLIPGFMDEQGSFVPLLDAKILSFKEYRYGLFSPPIWNLPGQFEKKRTSRR